MADELNIGQQIKTTLGKQLSVQKFIAEGGQGRVYLVNYNGENKALKWYKKGAIGEDPQAFYNNIKQNVMRGAPSSEFLWPQDITQKIDGTFGYVMDLRPEGYYEITDYMLCHVRFKSYKTVVDAALKIVSTFRILHNSGYSYQDLNDGNFFINPQTGDIRICDNDNVAPDGTPTGIIGKPRYMAPEIVLGKKNPDSLSDRFSMSVILYLLFCLNHPLEGKRYLSPDLTPEFQEELYGSEPIFIMDPVDTRNGPDPVIHRNSIAFWQCLPDYMKNIFLAAFCKKAFERPAARPAEIEWLKALTRFRSDIISCNCGNDIFTKDGKGCVCDRCGKNINVPFRLDLPDYSIPAAFDSRIYRCQLSVCDAKDALTPVAGILKNRDSGMLGIKNKTGKIWNALTSKGESRKVDPDEIVPLKDGIKLSINDAAVTIKSN